MSKYAQYELMKYKHENGTGNMLNQTTMNIQLRVSRHKMRIISTHKIKIIDTHHHQELWF